MINVKTITITSDASEDTSPHLLHVLRATEYPKLFPVLSKVRINVLLGFPPNQPVANSWKNEKAAQLVQVNTSTTMKSLDICAEFRLLTFEQLSEIFPNAVNLDLSESYMCGNNHRILLIMQPCTENYGLSGLAWNQSLYVTIAAGP